MHCSWSPRKLAGGWGGAAALLLVGCGSSSQPSASPAADVNVEVDVVQVTTLTTVQASSGLFLSPSARQNLPAYVARGETPRAPSAEGLERAKVDVALLFQSPSPKLPPLDAELEAPTAGEREPVEHYYPDVVGAGTGAVRWPLQPFRSEAQAGSDIPSEWSGWQAFGGLEVRPPGDSSSSPGAAAATLDYEVRGAPPPLVLSLNEADDLVVTNQSGQTVARALLVYSHPGGVAVTAIDALGPGASRITTLGPKEQPPEVLLERARASLADFFSGSVEPNLAEAMAAAKSTPFLETQGFRLISLLDSSQGSANLRVSGASVNAHQVVVSHSEILKLQEETRIADVVSDASLNDAAILEALGRFAEGKLELASRSSDANVSQRAQNVLAGIRGR